MDLDAKWLQDVSFRVKINIKGVGWSTRLPASAFKAAERCGMKVRVAKVFTSTCTGGSCSTARQLGPVVVSCPRHQNTPQSRKRNIDVGIYAAKRDLDNTFLSTAY